MTGVWLLAIQVLVVVLVGAGLIGSLLPAVPGTPLILAGALLHAIATDFTPIGAGRLLVLAGLSLIGYALDYVAGALGARRFGGSGWAVAGALLGAVVGLFFGLPGILLGPIVGAVGAELIRNRRLDRSLWSGLGTVIGMAVGAAAKFAIALVMTALFAWWVWRG